jgi:putative ABC transport system permease protein
MQGYLKNLGANMIVIPAELDLFAYFSADPGRLSSANLPESHFFRLFEARLERIEGIDPRLVVPLRIGESPVLLTGILPDKMLRPKVGEVGKQDPWKVVSLLSPDSKGAVLGAEAKEILGTQVDSIIRVSGRDIKVLGILPEQGTIDDLRVYINLRLLQKWFQRPSVLNEIRVLYTGNESFDKVASRIEGMLENTRVVTHLRMARKQIQTMDSIGRYALMLLAVILVLGCISIGNEMFHNAQARRREVGILMALGATTRTILVIFMLKAVFVALIGGILGYGVGTLVAVLLAPTLLQIHAYPILWLIPSAVLTAVVFSVVSSMAPSWRASRMDPGEILQET